MVDWRQLPAGPVSGIARRAARRLGILLPQLQQERAVRTRAGAAGWQPTPTRFATGEFARLVRHCQNVGRCAALALLALAVRDQSLAELGGILYSRYRSTVDNLEETAQAWLTNDAREPVSPATLRAAMARAAPAGETGSCNTLGGAAHAGQAANCATPIRHAHWPELFADLAGRVRLAEGGAPGSLEYQQVEQFQSVLASLSILTPVVSQMDYREALLAALERLYACVFQAQTPDAPIQLLEP